MPSFRQLAQAPVGGRSRRHRDDPKPVLLVHPLTDSVDHDVHRRLWPTCSTSASHRNPPAPRTAGGPSTASRPHTKAFAPLEWEHAPGGDQPFSKDASEYTKKLALRENRHVDPLTVVQGPLGAWSKQAVTIPAGQVSRAQVGHHPQPRHRHSTAKSAPLDGRGRTTDVAGGAGGFPAGRGRSTRRTLQTATAGGGRRRARRLRPLLRASGRRRAGGVRRMKTNPWRPGWASTTPPATGCPARPGGTASSTRPRARGSRSSPGTWV